MEGKWTSDLATILRSHKLPSVSVTCRGDDSSFGQYKHTLSSQFTQNPVTWKRGSKVFPYRLSFALKFVPFEDSLCWNAAAPDYKRSAFLHLFFINSMSVDEYKSPVRHLVSEWFAQVSTLPDVQWLIVVDSTRAKEKKNRSTLMDKIRSDFAKFPNRVIEVSESVEHGSFPPLVQAVQAGITQHLEIIVQSWEARLAVKKDQYCDENWSFVEYFQLVVDFARLFWSLGALEHSLSIIDELDRFITMITLEAAEDTKRESFWITKFRKSESSICPTIRTMLSPGLELPVSSYLGLCHLFLYQSQFLPDARHSLLCQQFVLCLHMYYLRSRSKGAAPSIRVDFAALFLKYAQHCQIAVSEHTKLLGFAIPLTRIACWTIFLVGDALNICGLLSDPTTIAAATSPLCHLLTERFNAMMFLSEDEGPLDSGLVPWLEGSHLEDGSILVDALKDSSTFSNQLQKIHDIASTVLVQSGRPRIASFIGWRFAKWLSGKGKTEQALPYKMRYLTRLLDDNVRSPMVIQMAKEILPQLHEARDRARVLSYLLLLSLNGPQEEAATVAEQFVKVARAPDQHIPLAHITLKGLSLLSVRLKTYPKIIHLPLDQLVIELEIDNHFPLAMKYSNCKLRLKGIDYTILTRNKEPSFELIYSKMEQVARMVSPNFNRLRGSLSPEESGPKPEIAIPIGDGELLPGKNLLKFTGEAKKKGCFIFDNFELLLLGGIVATFDTIDQGKEPVIVCIGTNPHKAWVEERGDYLAGLVQRIEISLEAGCNLDKSELFIGPSGEEHIEVMNASGEWAKNAKYPVAALSHGEKTTLSVEVYVRMDSQMTESPAVKRVKFLVEWEDRSWTIELPFVALFTTTTRISQLETHNLLEIEVSRTLANEWSVAIESARLEVDGDDGKPPSLGKLLNTDLQELSPNTVTNVVFLLPLDGDVPIQHTLFFDYRVKSTDNDFKLSRLFNFQMGLEMRVRSVLYEICTQMLSQQPGAQLCRSGSLCDLVVSLRSLKHTVELLYIVLDADAKLWTLNERAKVLQVKESGLGQIVFSVVPCTAGFLPFPSVSVYSCVSVGPKNADGTYSEGMDVLPGSPLISFHRTAGKQIRVLGASQGSQRLEEKKAGLKQKFVKLFD